MSPIIEFFEEKTPDHAGRYLSDIINADDVFLEKRHDWVQWVFPNKEPSSINSMAPVLTDEVIEEFKQRPDLRAAVTRALARMVAFYQVEEKYPWWCTKNNHNYLRCTRILHTLKAFGMQRELDIFYKHLCRIYEDNKEVIKSNTFSYWEDAYAGEQDYLIVVSVRAEVEAHRTIDVRASSLEEAKKIAITEVERNVSFVGDRSYQMVMDEHCITEITAEEE